MRSRFTGSADLPAGDYTAWHNDALTGYDHKEDSQMTLNPDQVIAKAVAAGEAAAIAVWDRDEHKDGGSCGGAMILLNGRTKIYAAAVAAGLVTGDYVYLSLPKGIRSQNADIPQAQYRAFRKVLEDEGYASAVKRFWTYVD
jgi:hypothetical protein